MAAATWVMFDYGCVISSPQPARDLAALASTAGAPLPRFRDAYWAGRHDYDLAELTAEAYWLIVAEQLGRTWDARTTAELVRLDVASWSHLRQDTVRLIEELAAADRRLAMLSNATREIAESVAALPVASHFEHLLFSCYLRAAKPDPRCFRAALTRLDAEPGRVVFLDDRPENVAAAADLGIHAIQFNDPQAVRSMV